MRATHGASGLLHVLVAMERVNAVHVEAIVKTQKRHRVEWMVTAWLWPRPGEREGSHITEAFRESLDDALRIVIAAAKEGER